MTGEERNRGGRRRDETGRTNKWADSILSLHLETSAPWRENH